MHTYGMLHHIHLHGVIPSAVRCRYLPSITSLSDCEPKDVPSTRPELIATTHGLLINELQHSPGGVLRPAISLLVSGVHT